CGKNFERKSDFDRHMKIHEGKRDYKCTFSGCAKTFVQRTQLVTHVNSHTKVRPHTCTKCPRTFSDPSARSRHEREQHGGLFYKCPTMCGKL
ncbi:hypothetical protein M422DRAFT_174044, partial [Sphaerobolus stellatus SS14]